MKSEEINALFAQIEQASAEFEGAEKEIDDILLTRYACYLIAQNGDLSDTTIISCPLRDKRCMWGLFFYQYNVSNETNCLDKDKTLVEKTKILTNIGPVRDKILVEKRISSQPPSRRDGIWVETLEIKYINT